MHSAHGSSRRLATADPAARLEGGATKRLLIAAVLALTLAACGGQTVHGIYMLQAQNVEYSGGSCSGVGRFSDLHDGTTVNVLDGAGAIVGTGKLVVDPAHSSNDGCQYTFEVGIGKAAIYQVIVGSRDPQTYTSDQLAALGYKITLYSPGAGG
jgi:hypothetical protein